MKIFIPSVITIASLFGCSTYQYVTIDSKNISRADNYLFVDETDSFRIEYDFSGYYGPVNIAIFNKTDKPLYVDWSKSAMIINNKAVSYYTPGGQISGTVEGSSYQLGRDWSVQQSGITATLKSQPGVDFIPPGSYKQTKYLELADNFIKVPANQLKRVTRVDGISGGKVKQADFTVDNSPVSFRSYLTFFIADDSKTTSFARQHNFYVSEVFQTDMGPRMYYEKEDRPANRFYINSASGFGKAAGVVFAAGLLTAASVTASHNVTSQ